MHVGDVKDLSSFLKKKNIYWGGSSRRLWKWMRQKKDLTWSMKAKCFPNS
ncbi:hypothetical protein Bca101_054388 [Brassica carinata]